MNVPAWGASLVALACIAASLKRLQLVHYASLIDDDTMLAALQAAPMTERVGILQCACDSLPPDAWERDLLAAVRTYADASLRSAAVEEQLHEVAYRLRRWDRVPRVCASIASSGAWVAATWRLRHVLLGSEPVELVQVPGMSLVLSAFGVSAAIAEVVVIALMGIAAAAVCLSIHKKASRRARLRFAAIERWVELLEHAPAPASILASATQARS